MSVSVIIPICGDPIWDVIAERAVRSVERQTVKPKEIIIVRDDTVSRARNCGAKKAFSDHLIFLDADDELDENYIKAMTEYNGTATILRPSTLGFYEDGKEDNEPILIPERDLRTGNYIVIGAMCRRDQFLKAGGFQEYPILEDWDLWCNMTRHAGASVDAVPEAIYRIGVREGSRNTNPRHGEFYNIIYRKNHTK